MADWGRSPSAVLVVLAAFLIAACSSTVDMPSAFAGMSGDEVGCKVLDGSDTTLVVGPLGASDSQDLTPIEGVSIHVGRTATYLIVVAESRSKNGMELAGSHTSIGLDEMGDDAVMIIQEESFGGGPALTIACWRGSR